MARDAQTEVNRRLWTRQDLVGQYEVTELRPVERVLLDRYRQELSGRVLEIGVGGGRFTTHLVGLGGQVHGIDISQAMVDHCTRKLPQATFEVRDLADVGGLEPASFDAVVATFNVVDVLPHAPRLAHWRDLRRILRDGGLLIESTHNLASEHDRGNPWRITGGGKREAVENLRRLPRRVANRRRMRKLETRHGEYAILTDEGHDYAVLHYYSTRAETGRQLADAGFQLLETLHLDGRTLPSGDAAPDCSELHYVARAVG